MDSVSFPLQPVRHPNRMAAATRIAQAPQFQGCAGHTHSRIRDTDRFYEAQPFKPLISLFQWSVHNFLSRPLGFKLQMSQEEIEKLRKLENMPGGLILTPNHSSIADAFTVQELGHQTGIHPATMTSLDSFDKKILKLPYQAIWPLLSRFGHFSVNAGNSSIRRSTGHAEKLVEEGTPLMVFPEGRFSWNNQVVSPCRNGTMRIALNAAQASQKPVRVVPIGIYYQYSDKAKARLESTLSRQEKALEKKWEKALPSLPEGTSPNQRIERLVNGVLGQLETQFGKSPVSGQQNERIEQLESTILKRLLQKYNAKESENNEPFQQIRYLCQAVYQQESKYTKPERLRDRLNPWSKPYKQYAAKKQETREDIQTLKTLEMLLLHKTATDANPTLNNLNSQLDAVARLNLIAFGKAPSVWQLVRGCTAQVKIGEPVVVQQTIEPSEKRFIDRANKLTTQLQAQIQQTVAEASQLKSVQ